MTAPGAVEPCRLGYEEHDGSRYCFAHAGFVIAGTRTLLCDRRPTLRLPLGKPETEALGKPETEARGG